MSQRSGAFASRNPLVAAQTKRDAAHGRSEPAPPASKRVSGADVRPHLTATRNTMLTGGIPVREGLQTTHKVVRDKTIREAIVFVLYTCLFLGILYEVNDVHLSYSQNNAVLDLFLDEEFEDATFKKNFFEVMTMEEMWTWLKGPLYNGAYPDEWYNGDPYTTEEEGYVLNYLRLVGGVQLRQERVSNHSCSIRRFTELCREQPDGSCEARFDTKDGTCFSEFSTSRQDTAPYGPGTAGFTWSDDHSDLNGLFGFGPNYGTGGYVVVLPLNRTEAWSLLSSLEDNLWTDRGTRAVAVDFNLYNTNARLLTVARVRFEFFANSHVQTSFKFFTFRIAVYTSRTDKARLVAEVCFLAFWLYYVQKEARRFCHQASPRYKYFLNLHNVYEIFLQVVCLAVIVQWLSFVFHNLRSEFDVNSPVYLDMFSFANDYSDAFSMAGFLAMCLFLKGFRYLGISKRLNSLWLTLRSALQDIITFSIGTMVVVVGFAYFAQLTFGTMLVDFHSLLSSVSTLVRYPLGDFDYGDLSRARPAMASIFFGSYMGIVFFVLTNMFIGIVTRHFDEVHEQVSNADRWKQSAMTWEAVQTQRAARKWRKWCACRKLKARRDQKKHRRNSRRRSLSGGSHGADEWADALSSEQAQADTQSDIYADTGLDLQSKFERNLHLCMRAAKRVHSIELPHYLDQVFRETDAARTYIGVHELCYLTSEVPCRPGTHAASECLAHRTVESYHKIKVVLMVGVPRLHRPLVTMAVQSMDRYPVVKINKNGRKQQRLMVIDHQGSLLNFTPQMVLRKRLPLEQLVQLEFSATNKSKVSLVFSSVGLDMDRDAELGGLETLYQLYLPSRDNRNAFVTALLKAHARAIDKHGGPGGRKRNPVRVKNDDAKRTPSESHGARSSPSRPSVRAAGRTLGSIAPNSAKAGASHRGLAHPATGAAAGAGAGAGAGTGTSGSIVASVFEVDDGDRRGTSTDLLEGRSRSKSRGRNARPALGSLAEDAYDEGDSDS